MRRRWGVLALCAAAFPAFAQSPEVTVPSQFATAHTIFLASGGAAPLGNNKEGAAMLYSSAYKALSSGRYRLTTTPAEADLSAVISIDAGFSDVTNGSSFEHPFVRLAVFDTKTQALLWNIDEAIGGAFRKATFQKNIDETMAKVIADLSSLAAGKLP